MNGERIISFIIPVYNVENYIKECVDSILNQIDSRMEMILVDDGSKDNSGLICDEFAKHFSNIRVVHQNNAGHSSARNLGLSLATGKYVAFVDSDDFISKQSLSKIIPMLESQDIDFYFLNGYKYFSNASTKIIDVLPIKSEFVGKDTLQIFNLISRCEKFPGSACTKIIKRELLVNNNIYFSEKVLYGEDLRFVVDCMIAAKSFDYLDVDYYYYRQGRSGSVTSAGNKDATFKDLSLFVIDMINLADKYLDNREALYNIAAYEYMVLLSTYCSLSRELKIISYQFFKDYRWVLKFAFSKKAKLIRMCISMLGFKMTFLLTDFWIRIR